jgi:hypothetical protein
LPNHWRRDIRGLNLTGNHQQLTMFRIACGDCCYEICQAGTSSDEGECAIPAAAFVEVFGRYSRRDFVYNGDALKSCAKSVDQMHAPSTRHKKTVGVSKFQKPVCNQGCVADWWPFGVHVELTFEFQYGAFAGVGHLVPD